LLSNIAHIMSHCCQIKKYCICWSGGREGHIICNLKCVEKSGLLKIMPVNQPYICITNRHLYIYEVGLKKGGRDEGHF